MSASTVSQRMKGRRTGVQISKNVIIDSSGFEDPNSFWESEKTAPTPSKKSSDGDSQSEGQSQSQAQSQSQSQTQSNEQSPALSSPDFDFRGGNSSTSSPSSMSGNNRNRNNNNQQRDQKRSARSPRDRQSMLSVGRLSDVETPMSTTNFEVGPPLSDMRGLERDRNRVNFYKEREYEGQQEEQQQEQGQEDIKMNEDDGNFGQGDDYDEQGDEEEQVKEDSPDEKTAKKALAKEKKRVKELGKKLKMEQSRQANKKKKRVVDDDVEDRVRYEDDYEGTYTGEVQKIKEQTLLMYTKVNVTPEDTADSLAENNDDYEDGGRKSLRKKFQPLKFWKNERLVFQPRMKEELDEDDVVLKELAPISRNFEVDVVGVFNALPSPEKKKSKSGRKKGTGVKAVRPFDESNLNKEYSYMEGEKATVWSESSGSYQEQKIISYSQAMIGTSLPITTDRMLESGASNVVGVAAQAFNIPQATEDVPGWISGHVILPPKGIKDAEGVGMCSQVFFVSNCQPRSFEVAIGAPEESTFSSLTAQRFLLSAGDFFHVPPNNVYRIENHSNDVECKLFWSIIRPMAGENQSGN